MGDTIQKQAPEEKAFYEASLIHRALFSPFDSLSKEEKMDLPEIMQSHVEKLNEQRERDQQKKGISQIK